MACCQRRETNSTQSIVRKHYRPGFFPQNIHEQLRSCRSRSIMVSAAHPLHAKLRSQKEWCQRDYFQAKRVRPGRQRYARSYSAEAKIIEYDFQCAATSNPVWPWIRRDGWHQCLLERTSTSGYCSLWLCQQHGDVHIHSADDEQHSRGKSEIPFGRLSCKLLMMICLVRPNKTELVNHSV